MNNLKKQESLIRIILSFLVIFLISKPLMQLVTVGISNVWFNSTQDSMWIDVIFLFSFVIYLIGAYVVVKIIEKRDFTNLHLSIDKVGLTQLNKFALLGMGTVILTFTVMIWGQLYQFKGMGKISLLYLVVSILAYGVQSSAEEILIRGYLHQRVQERRGYYWGLTISSLFFILPHLLAFDKGVDSQLFVIIVNLILISVIFTQVMVVTKSLWASIGLHLGWNYTVGVISGTSVSGMISTSSLFQFEQINSNILLTGGDYGIEASLVLTPILGCAILYLRNLRKREEC